jgi:RHS repeat-associated protein
VERRRRLAAFGVSQLGARLYDPAIGRFISRDPLLIPRTATTTNPYAFASNDPVNLADPSGLQEASRFGPVLGGQNGPNDYGATVESAVEVDNNYQVEGVETDRRETDPLTPWHPAAAAGGDPWAGPFRPRDNGGKVSLLNPASLCGMQS